MKDLGARVAVAVVGIPAFLALAYLGGWALGVPLALLAALGAGEVYRFAECRGVRPMSWLGMAGAAAVVLAAVARPDFAALAPWAVGVLLAVMFGGLLEALWARGPAGSPLAAVATTLFGVAYTGLPVASILLLHALPAQLGWGPVHASPWAGLAVVTLPLAATWIGDAAAYFVGSAWGRSKLFPSVSPGKSWVGAWAGVLAGAGAGAGWLLAVRGVLPGLPVSGVGVAAGVGAALGVGAIVGDLAESLLKREAGMKDSGRMFPGHGGILDRLDALAFTVPMSYALLRVLEWLA
ncbi:MAG: phosphatidate cytidylyltransferase [Longimicrobiales bacterium]|nr:phosphatidate cytidylyltransferase [Longimicrobiales bacterium]